MRYVLPFTAVCLATVLAAWTCLPPPAVPQVRPAVAFGVNGCRYEQVQFGMTEKQVEAIMGGPRGCYDGKEHNEPPSMALPIGFDSGDGSHDSLWYFSDCVVTVFFDGAGKTDAKKLETSGRIVDFTTPPPTAQRLDLAWRWVYQLDAPHSATAPTEK